MPKKRKPAIELTTDEAMERFFPKKVRDKAKEVAHEKDPKPKPPLPTLRNQVNTDWTVRQVYNPGFFELAMVGPPEACTDASYEPK